MTKSKTIEWILRIGVAGEFIGHGMLAIGGNKEWVGWIQKFLPVDPVVAGQILLVIGLMDLLLALVVLIKPLRPVLYWMAFWGLFTALLRPMVGKEIWDFIERFANWAAPLALALMVGKNEVGKNETV